eukprot:TRINITY_DN10344_c0_g1_i1.p1 TRINITY_DN10344_c0_g1~~TRINITY_DN10344_c0_g1_i1.p1  ORF type:complete len:123 (+),score=7.37 TRINITY_DN10344_c0_g1_i1:320-688(+)
MLSGRSRENAFVYLEASDSTNNIITRNVFYLSSLGQVSLLKANVKLSTFVPITASRISFQVTSDTVSPFTFLETPLCGHFSDNGFVILPDVPITIEFIGCNKIDVDQLETSIYINTLRETYV